jgi:phosphatidylserine/phosphatidylglycerophosphate/cardiolipin synthase-like enzyme
VQIKYLNEPYYIHAKVILIDPDTSFGRGMLGSSLFWSEGFELSREAGIIFDNQSAIQEIFDVFKYDWEIAAF